MHVEFATLFFCTFVKTVKTQKQIKYKKKKKSPGSHVPEVMVPGNYC